MLFRSANISVLPLCVMAWQKPSSAMLRSERRGIVRANPAPTIDAAADRSSTFVVPSIERGMYVGGSDTTTPRSERSPCAERVPCDPRTSDARRVRAKIGQSE